MAVLNAHADREAALIGGAATEKPPPRRSAERPKGFNVAMTAARRGTDLRSGIGAGYQSHATLAAASSGHHAPEAWSGDAVPVGSGAAVGAAGRGRAMKRRRPIRS